KLICNMPEEGWDAGIRVHLKGHSAPAHFAAAYWRQKSKELGGPLGASMVNTASESGLYGNAGQANYAAAKAGIAALSIVLARELRRIGVRVNAIAPVARTRLTQTVGIGDAPADGFDPYAPENLAPGLAWRAGDL